MLAYYGDDFTGSTDVLESLTRGGVPTVLFTEPPDAEMLARYPHVRAIGVAGNSRTMTPDQMEATLPSVFESLKSLRPAIVHYKVCSTFDSSPEIGSIGRAIDIGCRVFQNHSTPLVVGAPVLQRFCVFGNLFARSGLDSPIHRLDRHPTMRQHPVTPMTEADLRIHLSRQSARPVELVDAIALDAGAQAAADQFAAATREPGRVVLFDTITDEHLATIGKLIAQAQATEQKPLFVAGSSGIEYSLVKHWSAAGQIAKPADLPQLAAVDQVLAVSGSCSPVTDRQIVWAVENGFREVPLDTARLLQSPTLENDIAEIFRTVTNELAAGSSVIVHTSRGPADTRIETTKQTAAGGPTSERLGVILGRILRSVLEVRRVERVAVTGGDTSGYVARAVGIDALEMAGPLAPGAPLCFARSRHPEVDGVQFTFKGGQVGHDDFFGTLLRGRPNR